MLGPTMEVEEKRQRSIVGERPMFWHVDAVRAGDKTLFWSFLIENLFLKLLKRQCLGTWMQYEREARPCFGRFISEN